MASLEPAAPRAWPDSDLVELMSGMSPLEKVVRIASSSRVSPTGVEVPWALM